MRSTLPQSTPVRDRAGTGVNGNGMALGHPVALGQWLAYRWPRARATQNAATGKGRIAISQCHQARRHA